MVVIQENKTYFVSSRLHLPHGVGEEELTATFCQINYVNINGVKWKLKNTAYLKFLCITDCLLLVRYRRNEWRQFVGVLVAK
jgi:CRISPR/Cas system CMR-associated protein Cmr3 (group 5 of RAMP superfamily)